MPIYQYVCNNCLFEFELKKSFKENPDAVCPECGNSTRRIFSPVAVIFKGSGFYCTDHRSNSCLSSNDGEKEKAKTPAAKAETKPEKSDGKKQKNDNRRKNQD